MSEKELLKNLNYIDYSEDELKLIERESLDSKNEYAENVYKLQNEVILRKIAFSELNKRAKLNLNNNENLIYKGIFLVSMLEKNMKNFQVIVPGFEIPIYFGIFISNERIFIYKLTGRYKIIDVEKIQNIKDLKYINDERVNINTLTLVFKNRMNVDLRPINEENNRLLDEIIKYLNEEKSIEIKYEKEKRSLFYFSGVGVAIKGGGTIFYILLALLNMFLIVSLIYFFIK
ncbi:hypothetical protein [Clostridium sp.]|uniref:hypothetical protein n=1 Tax=Clostridium sp. TaxID=1506 RepID=UPI0029123677|nr:hypothetical protein [Clostridium sp.]MDU5106773.1 hypothetical protein [Clostridium sp.]